MKQIIRLLLIVTIVGIVLWIAGCTDESNSPVASTSISVSRTIDPKCMITGKILNRCTGEAISGAVISVGYDGVQSVVSDASGSFSFSNVPASQLKICTTCTVKTGTFTLTASMVDYNSRQTDPIKKYKNFYYDSVVVTFTSLDSVAVTGLAADVVFDINPVTILSGTVVNQSLVPVGNVTVTINDHGSDAELLRAKTDSLGAFRIVGVETGTLINIRAKSSDGSLEGSVIPYSIICNTPSDSARTQVMHEQIVLKPVDDMRPYVTSITPEDSADVSTTVQFVYTFSEPIQQNAYTVTTLGVGHGTIVDDISVTFTSLKKSQATLPTPAVVWSSPTTLTITPSGLAASSKYILNAATAIMKLKDGVGNFMQPNPFKTIKGDNEALYFTTAGPATAPAAPTGFARRWYVGTNPLVPLDYSGGIVGLQWDNVTNARSYNIYRKIGNGPFEMYHKDIYNQTDIDTTGALVNPRGANNPLGPLSVQFQVRAVSADLVEGSPSATIITVQDEVKPTLLGTVTGAGPTPNNWVYTLQFSEPLTLSSAQTLANYWIYDPDTVTFTLNEVDYLGYNSGTTRYDVRLNFSDQPAISARWDIRLDSRILLILQVT